MSHEERLVFWEDIVPVILNKKVYIHMCPLPSGFRDRAISLYRSLNLAPDIVLPSNRTAPLYGACESVRSVRLKQVLK